MKPALNVWLTTCLLTTAPTADGLTPPGGQSQPPATQQQAIDILKKTDAAAKAVTTAGYDARFEVSGWLADELGNLQGHALVGGEFRRTFQFFRFEIHHPQPIDGEKRKLTAGSDGQTFYLIDHQKKTVHTGPGASVLGPAGRTARTLGMVEFLHPTPFSDEINADRAELIGTATVGDQECYKIHVNYAGTTARAIWYIAQKDYLPRRVDRFRRNPATGQEAVTHLIVTNLIINPVFFVNPFELRVPPDYTRTDKPAR